MSASNWTMRGRPQRWRTVGRPSCRRVIGRLTTAAAAQALGMTPQQVRKLIQDGVIPARRVGKSWDTAEDAETLTARLGKKGKQRIRRVRKLPALVGQCADGCYWTKHRYRALEAARIARQQSRSIGYHLREDGHPVMEYPHDSAVGDGERDGVLYYRVSNPGVTDPAVWAEIDQAVSRFFLEQRCDPLSGQRRPNGWDRDQ